MDDQKYKNHFPMPVKLKINPPPTTLKKMLKHNFYFTLPLVLSA